MQFLRGRAHAKPVRLLCNPFKYICVLLSVCPSRTCACLFAHVRWPSSRTGCAGAVSNARNRREGGCLLEMKFSALILLGFFRISMRFFYCRGVYTLFFLNYTKLRWNITHICTCTTHSRVLYANQICEQIKSERTAIKHLITRTINLWSIYSFFARKEQYIEQYMSNIFLPEICCVIYY